MVILAGSYKDPKNDRYVKEKNVSKLTLYRPLYRFCKFEATNGFIAEDRSFYCEDQAG